MSSQVRRCKIEAAPTSCDVANSYTTDPLHCSFLPVVASNTIFRPLASSGFAPRPTDFIYWVELLFFWGDFCGKIWSFL
jgi:hypothetical protein